MSLLRCVMILLSSLLCQPHAPADVGTQSAQFLVRGANLRIMAD